MGEMVKVGARGCSGGGGFERSEWGDRVVGEEVGNTVQGLSWVSVCLGRLMRHVVLFNFVRSEAQCFSFNFWADRKIFERIFNFPSKIEGKKNKLKPFRGKTSERFKPR